MCLKLCFILLLVPVVAQSAAALSTETRNALLKGLRGKTLENRQARLQRLSALYANKGTTPRPQNASTTEEGFSNETLLEPDSEPDIVELSEKSGVADFLFQSDINLSEDQLMAIERSVGVNESTRIKRQVATYATRWLDNTVYYYYDPSIVLRKKTITKMALNYIQARTCITFIESKTAPNRIRVFNGGGCYSDVGMGGGVQDLSLADGCDQMGLVAHEFTHALGVWHMQMRDDRDDYIRVDLTNVPANMQGNFYKVSPGDDINYNPYDYGSIMHYGSTTFTTKGNSMIPIEGRYLRTLGSRVISFYDIKTINDHYSCIDQCTVAPAACANGGEPNPRNCAVCNCPYGYGGVLCDQRPTGCGATLTATAKWQVKQFTFGNAKVATNRDRYMLCNHWIKAPAGKQIQVRVTYLKNSRCQTGCRANSIEPKIKADNLNTNARICCGDLLNFVLTSELNPTPIVSYNRFQTSTFTFHYRYI
ncbi:hypothetical protein RB195_008600 [Necator americanus]|uniref:Zinc metalloproteinase n=1 Tax=Necator americanus TaxID=51031 RepID=A0ABR1CQ80_NECAM